MTSGNAAAVILSVVGARPNFMKLAPIARELTRRASVEHVIVHTGQHYDPEMSSAFFQQLRIPAPRHHLGVGSGSHAAQTAAVMQRLEPICLSVRPDLVLVYGDVNSTLAAALVAAKLGIPIGHVEAGLRSNDWTMPEEINRVLTDRLSQWLFAPSRDAAENLKAEGIRAGRIEFVGNVMIDSLCWALPEARRLDVAARLGLDAGGHVLVTLHRPANVDDRATLDEILRALERLAGESAVLFPLHPRTRERIRALGFPCNGRTNLRLVNAVPYVEMLALLLTACLVITDSGGLQEETTYLGIPCVTVRPSTERPITCLQGTNRLVPPRREAIVEAARHALCGPQPARPTIERWDGRAADRIVRVLCDGERFD